MACSCSMNWPFRKFLSATNGFFALLSGFDMPERSGWHVADVPRFLSYTVSPSAYNSNLEWIRKPPAQVSTVARLLLRALRPQVSARLCSHLVKIGGVSRPHRRQAVRVPALPFPFFLLPCS